MKKLLIFAFVATLFASCNKEYKLVGKWSVVDQKSLDKDGVTLTIVDSFASDGAYKETWLYAGQNTGGNLSVEGNYQIKDDSLIIFVHKMSMGEIDVPTKDGGRTSRKIIEVDGNTLTYEDDGKIVKMQRME